MFDKPVINVAYNPPGLNIEPLDFGRAYAFDHYRPVVESGAVALANNEAHMKTLIRQALTEPHERSASRHRLVTTMFEDTLDGWSSRRVASVLRALASEGSVRV